MSIIQNRARSFKREEFTSTASYVEQSAYRKIAKLGRGGGFTKSERSVLIKCVNLWFCHRGKTGYIEPSHDKLERSLGLSERTVRRAISKLRDFGIVTLLAGGRGRGRTAKYGVNLFRMMEVMWPDFAIKVDGFCTRLTDLIKGAKTPSPLYRTKTTPSQAMRLVHTATVETIAALGRRLRATVEPWYKRQQHQSSWSGNPSLVSPVTGEILEVVLAEWAA